MYSGYFYDPKRKKKEIERDKSFCYLKSIKSKLVLRKIFNNLRKNKTLIIPLASIGEGVIIYTYLI